MENDLIEHQSCASDDFIQTKEWIDFNECVFKKCCKKYKKKGKKHCKSCPKF